MKIVEIVPRNRTRLYGALVAKETAIRQRGRGTYMRVGRRSQRSVRWKHKMYVDRHSGDEVDTVTIQYR